MWCSSYGPVPKYTYMTGLSNGGYLTRLRSKTIRTCMTAGWIGRACAMRAGTEHVYVPAARDLVLPHVPRPATGCVRGDLAAGFAPGSEFLWEHHCAVYWDLSQRTYREEMDPKFDGALRGVPFCPTSVPFCDADYDYASRPQAVQAAAESRAHRPYRQADDHVARHAGSLLPIANSDPYAR